MKMRRVIGVLLTAALTIVSQTEQPVPPPGGVLWWEDGDCKGSSLGLWWDEPARHPPRSSPDHTNTSGSLK